MNLLSAFAIRRRDVVAIVGAGGKTTLLRTLGAQARAAGLTVLSTTTTHLGPADGPVLIENGGDRRDEIAAALRAHGQATLLGLRVREDKMQGVAPERVDALRAVADLVLVEADGARGRSLKMPAPHEPVIPSSATLVIVVAALDALGQPLDAQRIHRLEIVTAALGLPQGTVLGAADMARALSATYPSRVPPGARTAVFLNKAETHPGAAEVARGLAGAWGLVVAGSAREGTGGRLGEA